MAETIALNTYAARGRYTSAQVRLTLMQHVAETIAQISLVSFISDRHDKKTASKSPTIADRVSHPEVDACNYTPQATHTHTHTHYKAAKVLS